MSGFFLKKHKKKPSLVALQAGMMSLGTALSRIFGFLRDICIAGFFSRTETDIFFAAFRFPNFFRRIFGEGSFSASVTPVLTEVLQKKGRRKAKELSSHLFSLLFCLTGLLSLIGVLFMEDIMNLFFAHSAYAQIEGKVDKTIILGRLVFSYLFFVSLYAYFMSVAQVFGRFFLPALAPALLNISLIAFSFSPQSWWPFPSYALGWAVILGGALQLLPVVYELLRLSMMPRFIFRVRLSAETRKTLKRFLPGILSLSGLSLIGLVNVYFAAWLDEGSHSYIYYGDRLMEFPRSLIAVSLGSALVPELTRLYSLKKLSEFKSALRYHIRFLLFLTLPCVLIFAVLPIPVVKLIFARGEFDSESVLKTAMILQFYSLVLLFSSLSRTLSSCFFALDRNWRAALYSLAFVCFHTLCARILTPAFGLKGLVGATALSSVFYFLLLAGALSFLMGGRLFKGIGPSTLKYLPGLALLTTCLLGYPLALALLSSVLPSFLSLFFALSLCLAGGLTLYIMSALWMREEMAEVFTELFRRFLKKIKLIGEKEVTNR